MKAIVTAAFIALISSVFAGCIPKNAGEVTLVNSGITSSKIAIGQRSFLIRASHHITKPVEQGLHRVTIDGDKTFEINVARDKTTVFDSTGLSCYAVVDFTGIYNGGEIKIIEKSFRQRAFMTTNKMALVLGEHLPKKIEAGKKLFQVVQIDCEIIGDDKTIISEVQPH